MSNEQHIWDQLSDREAQFVDRIMGDLANTSWAQPLLTAIQRGGGLIRANKAKFFELRLGYALHKAGIKPRYEVPGEGNSTLDFGFTAGGREWLVELMRLEETKALREATQMEVEEDGVLRASLNLDTDADKPGQSIEGEVLKTVQRICQKCNRNGQPHKFPLPSRAHHVILVDIRTFVEGGGDQDLICVGLGGEYALKDGPRLKWEGQLISGVFSKRTLVQGAVQARARVHFLGFVRETKFEDGGFAAGTKFIANPHLLPCVNDARAAISDWPLQPAQMLEVVGPKFDS